MATPPHATPISVDSVYVNQTAALMLLNNTTISLSARSPTAAR